MRLTVYVTPRTNPRRWFELRGFFFLFGSTPDAMLRVITNNWHHCVKCASQYCEQYFAMRQAFDLRGTVEQHYLRCLDAASVTTAGILIIAGICFLTVSPVENRPRIWEHLDSFLHPLFEKGDFDIVINVEFKHIRALSSTPSSGGVELAIDEGMVDATAFFLNLLRCMKFSRRR